MTNTRTAKPQTALTVAWVTLAALGLRGRHAEEVQQLGGPEAALALGPSGLRRALGSRAPRKLVTAERPAALFVEAGKHATHVTRWCEHAGGRVVTPGSLGRVARAPGAPLVVFGRGPVELLHRRPVLGVVGSRDASERGIARARQIAREAAAQGAVVVSGGARGIDIAAHAGALQAGGETVVVMGDPVRGAEEERPTRVRELCEGARALTLTAHGPWTPMTPRLWVARNTVLAALCDVVVVVEGRARSGTRHTAEAALAIGLPLLVVPGDPDEDLARTPNALLKLRGARPLLDVGDALDLLFSERPARRRAEPAERGLPLDLAAGPKRLLLALQQAGGVATPDDLARVLGAAPAALLGDAFDLELRGLVARVGASWRVV